MTKAPAVIVLDFETDAIEGRPKYPPRPVGFSIKWPKDRKAKYWGWGHPEGNNCDWHMAVRVLKEAWASNLPVLMQNAKFDLDVAEEHMDCPMLPWERIHDTLYLIFLADPHAQSYGLKPAAERFLAMAPTEQEDVRNWLVTNNIVRKNDSKWGACISKAPGGLVGKYADGDVTRTLKLFDLLYPRIVADGMREAYERELQLMPILLANERQGIRVDLQTMRADNRRYTAMAELADDWLRKRLKAPGLNIDSNDELAKVLDTQGVVTDWVLTTTGKKSTAKKNMTLEMFNDKKIANVLGYRNRLNTCLGTFIQPWLAMAEESGGVIYTNWNQVRQNKSTNAQGGTRTGRLSSNPNFQNIPKTFEGRKDGYSHPAFLKDLTPLPLMRRYVLPDKNGVFLHRDYSQQELRILAHFEGGQLLQAYQDDPELDMHDYIRDAIAAVTGRLLDRDPVKTINFGILYGMGYGSLAAGMQMSVEEARDIKKAHRKGVPGIAQLEKDIKDLGKAGEAVRTWGGRVYYTEPAKLENGVVIQTFEYKLLNYLIQGSAADCTKQALINYNSIKKEGRFLVTVHDEMNISAPKGAAKREMKLLQEAMESVPFDVKMLSDGKSGPNWGELTKWPTK